MRLFPTIASLTLATSCVFAAVPRIFSESVPLALEPFLGTKNEGGYPDKIAFLKDPTDDAAINSAGLKVSNSDEELSYYIQERAAIVVFRGSSVEILTERHVDVKPKLKVGDIVVLAVSDGEAAGANTKELSIGLISTLEYHGFQQEVLDIINGQGFLTAAYKVITEDLIQQDDPWLIEDTIDSPEESSAGTFKPQEIAASKTEKITLIAIRPLNTGNKFGLPGNWSTLGRGHETAEIKVKEAQVQIALKGQSLAIVFRGGMITQEYHGSRDKKAKEYLHNALAGDKIVLVCMIAHGSQLDSSKAIQQAKSAFFGDKIDRRFLESDLFYFKAWKVCHKKDTVKDGAAQGTEKDGNDSQPRVIKLLRVLHSSNFVDFPPGWMSPSIKVGIQQGAEDISSTEIILCNDHVFISAKNALVRLIPGKKLFMDFYSKSGSSKIVATKEHDYLVIVMSESKAEMEELQGIAKDIQNHIHGFTQKFPQIGSKYTFVVLKVYFS